MKHVTGRHWRQIAALGSMGATFVIACAGNDIPPTTDELRGDLESAYSGSPTGNAGTGGSAGAGGSNNEAGAAGSGGDGGDGGSAGAAGAGGGGDAGAAGAGGAAAGAGGAGGGAAGAGSTEVCDGFAILQASCGQSTCHGDPGPFGNFAASLEDAQSFIGEEGGTSCNGYGPLIDPANPEDSIIVNKLGDTPDCGGQMPQGGDPLSQEDIDCIVEWIGSLE